MICQAKFALYIPRPGISLTSCDIDISPISQYYYNIETGAHLLQHSNMWRYGFDPDTINEDIWTSILLKGVQLRYGMFNAYLLCKQLNKILKANYDIEQTIITCFLMHIDGYPSTDSTDNVVEREIIMLTVVTYVSVPR